MILVSFATAHAAGFYVPDTGTRALGRGSAFVAGADDLTAMYHNPGALVRIEQAEVMLNLGALTQPSSFARAPTDTTTFDTVENQGAPFVIPTFGVATRFGLPNTVFAFGFTSPSAPETEFPSDGAQRYHLIDSLEAQVFIGPTVAHRFADQLSVGVGIKYSILRAERAFAITTCVDTDAPRPCSDDPIYDIGIDFAGTDAAAITGNVGVLWEPSRAFAIGASLQPPVTYEAAGTLEITMNEDHPLGTQLSQTTWKDDDVAAVVKFPLVARVGVQVRPADTLAIELAGVLEAWSRNDEIVLEGLNVDIETSEDAFVDAKIALDQDVPIPQGYQDAYGLRLGSELTVGSGVVRAGALLETSGVPPEKISVASMDATVIGGSVGGGLTLGGGRIVLDGAFAYNHLLLGEVDDSTASRTVMSIDLANPAASGLVDGAPAGNGTYRAATLYAGLGVTARLGALKNSSAGSPPSPAPQAP